MNELIASAGAGIAERVDKLNSKRFFAFLGGEGAATYILTLTATLPAVAPFAPVLVAGLIGLPVVFIVAESIWPSKTPEKNNGDDK
jgi:hypothetical protein